MKEEIKEVIRVLKEGGIIIFPTDTAFGIGCKVSDEKAVERLFKIRKRPLSQPVPVLVDTIQMAKEYTDISKDVVDQLVEPYWPGALTIILNSINNKVPNLVRGGGTTIGLRIPNHPVARAIIRGVGEGILGPSSNFHGDKTPYQFNDLNEELIKMVDYVVKGECYICKESTVIDCSVKPWKILREGAISVQSAKFKVQNLEKPIILKIDTSSNKEIKVGLRIDGKEEVITKKIGKAKAQIVLPMIEKILKKNAIKLKDLTGVEVNIGKGSFTGLRVGISVANALGFALRIPVNNRKIGEFVEPTYE